MRLWRRPMTVRVGELTSEVQVTGGGEQPGGEAAGRGQAARIQPSWTDLERHVAMERAKCRDEARTSARRFDG
jgi:hypothetical protein